MEILWLIIAIAAGIYTIYKVSIGAEMNPIEYAMPVIAFVLYISRRTLRRKLAAAKEEDMKS